MTALTEPQEMDLVTLEHAAAHAAGSGPGWFASARQAASERFGQLGLPTTRDEPWRFTSIEPIRSTSFALEADQPSLSDEMVAGFAIPGLSGPRLVFVNGVYAGALSNLGELPAGVRVGRLAAALESDRRRLEPYLGQLADCQDSFVALNTACIDDGLFVHVPASMQIEQPIEVLHIATATPQPLLTNPRNLIVAEDGAKVTVIEHFVSLDEGVYFSNAVTELVAGNHATVDHYLLEFESERAFNFSTLAMRQLAESHVSSHTILFGGCLVRNNINPVLAGNFANCLVNGLYMPKATQHMDNHMRVEHARPHGDSRQFYKGVLRDRAKAVFSGRIIVAEGAQKTDAKQTNANLLLSDDAQVNTMPQLEIYADDVKCTHGATVGQIDPQAIYYLCSRGIRSEAARAMLVYAFAAESLERVPCQPVRAFLERRLVEQLPQAEVLAQLL